VAVEPPNHDKVNPVCVIELLDTLVISEGGKVIEKGDEFTDETELVPVIVIEYIVPGVRPV
jgi:hypothetical protein